MGRHVLKAGDSEGFLRAFTDCWVDTENCYQVVVTLAVLRSGRRGVLSVVLTAWADEDDLREHPQAKYTCEYPTAAVATFEASLFQAINRLDRILDQQGKWPMGKA